MIDGPVPLGRIIQAGIDIHGYPTRARIVIFRMPIEQRVQGAKEQQELLTIVLIVVLLELQHHLMDLELTFLYIPFLNL